MTTREGSRTKEFWQGSINMSWLSRTKYRYIIGQISEEEMLKRMKKAAFPDQSKFNFTVFKEMSLLRRLREACLQVLNNEDIKRTENGITCESKTESSKGFCTGNKVENGWVS